MNNNKNEFNEFETEELVLDKEIQNKPNNSLRIMSFNVYLIPSMLSKNNLTCIHKDIRANGIGKLITHLETDIVCLQEMWGSDKFRIESYLKEDYEIIQGYESWNWNLIDIFVQHLKKIRRTLWGL
eukprot:TRINITY_DN11026_c0_g1_i1.p1 TRINITY_DN11026_c0_g1~~TRINITY_DN11026_c0_g1_i1.p1  ORF type:complete len:135 (+),score=24.90 TRINITY_DN11026_c0_g1_i1:29-406(+)